MRTRSIAILFALAMLAPLLARGEGPKRVRLDNGRVGATRQQIADHLNAIGMFPPNVRMSFVKSGVRISTEVDKDHFKDHHTHIQGHTPRIVKWSYPAIGLSGTARSDTPVSMGPATTVTKIKTNPPPWSTPSQTTSQAP
jgi:hypothetical protein